MYGEKKLDVTVFRARKLEDVDKLGSNDPYVFVFTDLEDLKNKNKIAKTHTAKDGKNPKWDQQLHLEELTDRTEYLYVEVMDDETTVDEPIAFTAIPLSQVREAPGERLQAEFDLFDEDGRKKGTIILGLRLRDKDERAIEEEEQADVREGSSQVVSGHQKRFKSLVTKEHAADAAQAIATGAALLGGLFALKSGGNKPKAAAHEQ
ncbi:Extended synaptotagmin-1 [Actinomortierella ambigua]|nr:Extended synaptotagmin-1 [Actinomortierella ambigua]